MHYLDTSALVKLIVDEAETAAFRAWLRSAERHPVTSDLTRTELVRAVRRMDIELMTAARTVLRACMTITVTGHIWEEAARLEPVGLRSLDAVHLACALSLSDRLDGFLTYDDRLAESAAHAGLSVMAPA